MYKINPSNYHNILRNKITDTKVTIMILFLK